MENERIYGIKCSVSNCVYNKNDCECMAGDIKIGRSCSDPCTCKDTECVTFKPRG